MNARRERLVVLFLAALTLLAAVAYGGGLPKHEASVTEWVDMLQRGRVPTLADYLRFEGSGSEWETQLELSECERRRWVPPVSNPECRSYVRSRADDPAGSPSLFLTEVRKLIPEDAAIGSVTVAPVPERDDRPHLRTDIVRARIGDLTIEFVVPQEDRGHFGELSINRIGSDDIDDLVERWSSERQ